jgi:hypothetical protein
MFSVALLNPNPGFRFSFLPGFGHNVETNMKDEKNRKKIQARHVQYAKG